MATKTMVFEKDLANKKLNIERSFDGSLEKVWKAWTDASILDQWWAPKPYRAETKKMDFRVGGTWLYSMIGPEGDIHWSKEDYKEITPMKHIVGIDGFCDENGNDNADFPKMYWDKKFSGNENETTVKIVISFDDEAALQKYLEMGFKEGFEAGLNNLDEVLEQQQ